jgi:GxxExxY protein
MERADDRGLFPGRYHCECMVLLEIKSVEKTIPVYGKQVLTYLRISGLRLGLLLNFEYFSKFG